MVQTFAEQTHFPFAWTTCVQAYFLRYPNPRATHVLTSDVVDRRIEQRPPRTPSSPPSYVLCTSRLMLKRGSLPGWAPKNIIRNTESWVLEESETDLDATSQVAQRTMSVWTRNLDHTSVLAVTEGIQLVEEDSSSILAKTGCITTADIRSSISFGMLRRRIEKFGFKRFLTHKDTSREGLVWSIERLPHLLDPSNASAEHRAESAPQSTRSRLLHALRPPFLDGYPLGPVQWVKKRMGSMSAGIWS